MEIRLVVAIAHLEGDDGHKTEGQLHDALADLDPKLLVTPVILNRTITLAGRPQGIAHLEALTTVTDVNVESLIWGAVNGASHSPVGPLYATRFGDYAQSAERTSPAISNFRICRPPISSGSCA